MNTRNADQQLQPSPRRGPAGEVDFTFMYAAHDAFHRDLRRLVAAVDAGHSAAAAVRTGWATFKNQLHLHHSAEDRWLWPAVRAKVTRPAETSVLDAMEAEHLLLEPLLPHVDAALVADDLTGLAEAANALAAAFTAHLEHEEEYAFLYTAAWRPRYARTPRWITAAT